MAIDLISLIALLASLATIGTIVVRKFPELRALKVASLPQERHAQVKKELIAQRLRRKLLVAFRWTSVHTQPFRQELTRRVQAFVRRVETLEREYRTKAQALQTTTSEDALLRVTAILDEAEALQKEGKTEQAEHKYIEAIALAPSHAAAFRGLGELYLAQKDYEHAEESLRYALKLTPDDAHLLLDLADVYRATGDTAAVLRCCQGAVALGPNNPKSLDALLAASIAMHERDLAQRTFDQLVAVNPENQKLEELRQQIEALPSSSAMITKA